MIASDDGQKLFLGIDPGQSGGLAILNDAGLVVDVSGMDRESANARAFENWFCRFIGERKNNPLIRNESNGRSRANKALIWNSRLMSI
jgi:hypothetical protein